MRLRYITSAFLILASVAVTACDDDKDADDQGSGGTAGESSIRGGASGRGGAASGGSTAVAGTTSLGGSTAMGGTGQGGMAGGSSSSVDLDDAEVLHAATTLNGGEVAEAQLALSRSENSAVRTYAEQMVAEHGLAIQQIATLAATQQLTPDDNPISESLRVKSEANLKALAAESAERFDRQYILSQVAMHQSALALVDAQLIPSAERAEIDTLLASLRTTVAEHLTRAQAVLATLP